MGTTVFSSSLPSYFLIISFEEAHTELKFKIVNDSLISNFITNSVFYSTKSIGNLATDFSFDPHVCRMVQEQKQLQ